MGILAPASAVSFESVSFESDPRGLPLSSPGAKADNGKPRVALALFGFLPALRMLTAPTTGAQTTSAVLDYAVTNWPRALESVSEVTTAGAAKYTPNGWVDVPNGIDRYLDAYGRHALKLGAGEIIDDGEGGTGCRHDAQACWNLLAALSLCAMQTPRTATTSGGGGGKFDISGGVMESGFGAGGGGAAWAPGTPDTRDVSFNSILTASGTAAYDAARFLPLGELMDLTRAELDGLEAVLSGANP